MDKVMPPKKSKAARKTAPQDEADVGVSKKQNGHGDDEGEESSDEEVNIFKERVIEGKRKRFAPVAEQTLQDWLKKNFVEKEESNLSGNEMYQAYLEMCSSMAAFGVDVFHFHKAVKEMFPKGFGLVEDSPYKDTIKVKKLKKKSTKVEADSLQIKMRDIIKEAIIDLGNGRNGVRFKHIKNSIASKYPALRVELREWFLKNAVFRELRYAHIECVRGVGACGYYRLPRTPEEEEREEEEEKEAEAKIKKEKEAKAALKKETSEGGTENAEMDVGATDGEVKKKVKKEKKKDTDAAVGTEDGTETKTDDTAADAEKKKKKKKKKSSKQKKSKWDEVFIVHSQPDRIEDVFPLAMTYNSEPKEASVPKIRKYIIDHYDSNLNVDKLKKCLESGSDRGYWAQISGHGGSGSFQLTINEFDPTADDDMTGMIMNAIVACTEPKTCSALLLKKYVIDYHPGFKVADRPHLFKKALQRAMNVNAIVQLSGIGASGSFQLVHAFTPSPTVLQGSDTAHDHAVEGSDDESFHEAYVPRATKRGGHGRAHATKFARLDPSLPNPRAPPPKHSAKHHYTKPTSKYTETPSDSDDEPPQKKFAGKKKTTSKKSSALKRKGQGHSIKSRPADSESDVDSELEVYTPRKSASRGGSARPLTAAARKAPPPMKLGKAKKATPAKKGKAAKIRTSDDESDSDVEVISPPKSRSKLTATQVRGKAASVNKGGASSDESDDEPPSKKPAGGKTPLSSRGRPGVIKRRGESSVEEQYVPKLTLSRGGTKSHKKAVRPPSNSGTPSGVHGGARGGVRGGIRIVDPDSSEDEIPVKTKPANKGGKKKK